MPLAYASEGKETLWGGYSATLSSTFSIFFYSDHSSGGSTLTFQMNSFTLMHTSQCFMYDSRAEDTYEGLPWSITEPERKTIRKNIPQTPELWAKTPQVMSDVAVQSTIASKFLQRAMPLI